MTLLVDWLARSLWTTLAAVAVLAAAAVAAGRTFDLSLSGAVGLYFVVWWLVLFTILPIRITSQVEHGEVVAGTDPGAPAAPALRERAIWTSIVSAALFAAISALFPLAGL